MTTDIKELKRLASSAELGCLSHGNKRSFAELDAFHVAAHPSAVLDLIAKIEQLEAKLSAQTAEPYGYVLKSGYGIYYRETLAGVEPDFVKHWVPLYTHPAKTEQPSLSDARIYEFANAICTPTNGGWHFADGKALMLFARALLSAQRQDSDKDAAHVAFVGQCHPGCHAKPSASMGVCHTMFCPVRDIANGAPK